MKDIELGWRRAERGQFAFQVDDGAPIGAREIRDAWVYGRVTHQGPEWQDVLEKLRESGDLAVMALQMSLISHSRCILALDMLVAEVLGEQPVWQEHKVGDEEFF